MNGLQFFVLLIFTIGNLWVTAYNRSNRYPESKSRKQQIRRIRNLELRQGHSR